jgi:taurine dioxygenase
MHADGDSTLDGHTSMQHAISKGLSQRRITSAVGAVIDGVDLREPLAADAVQFIRQSLLDHGVIFFHNQNLSAEQMSAFVSHFAKPIPEPFLQDTMKPREPVGESNMNGTKRATSIWHSDTTFVPEPPSLTALRAVKLPAVGGDTCWSSMYAAYEALSQPMQQLLDGLTALHSIVPVLQRMPGAAQRAKANEQTYGGTEYAHPVVRVHPDTGRKALFVNEGWTTRIVEVTQAESVHLLSLLFEHVKSPDFMMRWCWTPNDVALWDNRSVQHYAVPDYDGERVMQRVVMAGDRPRGPR